MFLSFQALSVDCFKNLYSLPKKKKKKRSEAVSATLLCLVALIKIVVISC